MRCIVKRKSDSLFLRKANPYPVTSSYARTHPRGERVGGVRKSGHFDNHRPGAGYSPSRGTAPHGHNMRHYA